MIQLITLGDWKEWASEAEEPIPYAVAWLDAQIEQKGADSKVSLNPFKMVWTLGCVENNGRAQETK